MVKRLRNLANLHNTDWLH